MPQSYLPGYNQSAPDTETGFLDKVRKQFQKAFASNPIALSQSNDPYVDPTEETELLREQNRQRRALGMHLAGTIGQGVRGEYVGAGYKSPYQHYVPDYGAPLRGLAQHMAGRNVLGESHGEESTIFNEGQRQLGQYARGAAERYQQTAEAAHRRRMAELYRRRTGRDFDEDFEELIP